MTAPSPVDGGAAFPSGDVRDADGMGISEGSRGMSLRDWFAGELAGVVLTKTLSSKTPSEDVAKNTAFLAYAVADAMLAERAK